MTPDDALMGCRLPYEAVGRFSPYAGMGWIFFGLSATVYNHVLPPNSSTPDCAAGSLSVGSSMAFTARSFHPGGVNAVRADGSVRFTSQEISLPVWRALATIDGREAPDDS
jgi:prepilin-type processing-associated H-X9-DG protein